MKSVAAFLLYFFCVFMLRAQNFQKYYGGPGDDRGHSVIQTMDGGYAIAGFTTSFGAGGEDLFLIKTDALGNVLWQKTFGTTNNENGNSVALAQAADSGYVVGGYTLGFGAVDWDLYVLKTDANGTLLWENKYATSTSKENVRGIKILDNGDIVIAGTDDLDNLGSSDGLVMRLDSGGNLQWSKVYGGNLNDHLHGIEVLQGGNMIIAGSSTTYGPGGTAGYVIKINSGGNFIWDYTYGGNGSDGFNSSAYTNDDMVIMTGLTNSYGAGGYDVILTKIDTNGVVQWTKVFGGANYERGASVKTIPNSNDYYVYANTQSYGNGNGEVLVIRTNSLGDIVWAKTFGTSMNEGTDSWAHHSLASTSDGGFVITGWSDSLSVGGNDIFLVKGDSLGSILCSEALITVSAPTIQLFDPASLAAPAGNYYSVSSIVNSPTFIDTSICYCVSPDVCVNCTSPVAGFVLDSIVNGTLQLSDASTGATTWQWDFGDGYQSSNQNPQHTYQYGGWHQICLTVTNGCGSDTFCDSIFVDGPTGLSEIAQSQYLLYPNPSSERVFVEFGSNVDAKIIAYNMIGEEILKQEVQDKNKIEIVTGSWSSGVYVFRIEMDGFSHISRYIKQ